jgi:hypothetical protein
VSVEYAPLLQQRRAGISAEDEGRKARDEGRALLGKFISGGKEDLVLGVRGSPRTFIPEGSPAARNDSCMAAVLGRVVQRFGTLEIRIPRGLLKIGGGGGGMQDDDDTNEGDDGGEDDGLHFIQDATFHLFSSSATFVLLNPLPHDPITILRLNATALYPRPIEDGDGDGDDGDDDDGENPDRGKKPSKPHDPSTDDPWLPALATATTSSTNTAVPPKPTTTLHPIAHIFYSDPLTIPPPAKRPLDPPDDDDDDGIPGWTTPKLPVEWSLGSVGYEAVRKALGGSLKVGARAEIDVGIGKWREQRVVFEREGGIGAKVRL